MPMLTAPIMTATLLRTAIRQQIANGVSKRTISQLVYAYSSEELGEARDDGDSIRRQAVEHIPHGRRAAFLAALAQLDKDEAQQRRLAS